MNGRSPAGNTAKALWAVITGMSVGALSLVLGCGGGDSETPAGGGPTIQLDLPFAYTTGARSLEVPTPGGPVFVKIGAYGAHFEPHTGDTIGEAKSNLQGYLAEDTSSLSELPSTGGNGDGQCDAGESCGFFGGTGGALVRSRIPVYTAPLNGTLTSVRLNAPPGPGYFDSVPHWEIQMSFNGRFGFRIGHLGKLAPSLRDKVLAATGVNTDTYTGPVGNVLINGAIPISAGEMLAYPQLFARQIASHPGYYQGGGSNRDIPWAQMEFTISDNAEGADVCVYDLMESSKRAAVQAVMNADMADPASARYGPYASTRWVWGAEGVLCLAYSPNPADFSSIHARLGGWTERPSAGTTVDENFGIAPIAKSAATYAPGDYDSPSVNYLVGRTRGGSGGSQFNWTMPGGSTVAPFYPKGEVLEETANGLMVKWRDIGWTGPAYQRATFVLDAQGLKIKWGAFAASAASAVAPVLNAGDPCDDRSVICYDHEQRI